MAQLNSPRFAGIEVLEQCLNGSHFMQWRDPPETGIAVERIQQALIDLGYAIPSGPTGNFMNETKAAVESFQAAHGLHIDGIIGADTMQVLDNDVVSHDGAIANTTVQFTNEYGDPLSNVLFTVASGDEVHDEIADNDGRARLRLAGPAVIALDQTSAIQALGDLLDRDWPPTEPVRTAGALTTPANDIPVEIQPGDQLEVVVASRAALTTYLVAPIAGTPRVDGTGAAIDVSPDGVVTLAVQANGGAIATVFVDPDLEPTEPVVMPTLEGWTPIGTFTVRDGDTADSLALALLGDVQRYGELSEHEPVPGEVLALPPDAIPGWLDLVGAVPEPATPIVWMTISPDAILAGIVADGDPGELHDALTALDRPPAPQPDPSAVVARRAQVIATILTVEGPPLGPDPQQEAAV